MLLARSSVSAELHANTKEELIAELVELGCRSGGVLDRRQAVEDVLDRERKMTTGMDGGVALPHARTASVERSLLAAGVKPSGLAFGAVDGEPSRIFILALSPVGGPGRHLSIVAEMGRKLTSDRLRRDILTAHDDDLLHAILSYSLRNMA
jgi:PTS system nitrogen regulatory IIA component